ncbi:MAG: hypothetical protein AB7E47_02315 [Desulfovibrionaceae bacterium]
MSNHLFSILVGLLLGVVSAIVSKRIARLLGVPEDSTRRDLIGLALFCFGVVLATSVGFDVFLLAVAGIAVGLYDKEVKAFLSGKRK